MGGPAHQAALLSGRDFFPDRYETLLIHGSLPAGEKSAEYLSERAGVRRERLDCLVQPVDPRNDARAFASLARTVRRFRPQIVHTHTAKAGFLGRAAAIAATRPGSRPKLVHTFHGHVLEGYFGPAKNRAFTGLERTLAARSDRLIGVSDNTVDDLVRLGVAPREKFMRLALGLDLSGLAAVGDAERARSRDELGIAEGEVVCIFVGRIVPIKRLDVLLEAFASAHGSIPKLRLLVVGDGEERPEHETHATRLGITGRVDWLGYRSDLARLFAAADIAVISSDNEGTPVSLIEAGAAGVPAVTTDVGGVTEVIGQGGGLIVPRREPEALGAAIARVAGDHRLRAALGEAIRVHVLAHYSADRLRSDIDELYSSLLGGV